MSYLRGGSARTALVLAALGLTACGAADERLDPADLELRDLLGVSPTVAAAWDDAQREAARHVLAGGLISRDAEPLAGPPLDQVEAIGALDAVDDRLLGRDRDALGLVVVEPAGGAADGRAIDAPVATAALLGDLAGPPAITLELDPRAWPCPEARPCNFDLLAALAADAAPGVARVRVVPVVELAVIAALLPGGDGVPTMMVNPIVTAVGEPAAAVVAGGGASPGSVAPAAARVVVRVVPLVTATWAFAPSIAACADSVQDDCNDCLAGGTCEPIWSGVSGMDACTMLQVQFNQNYALLCINLAVSLGQVGTCLARDVPSCTFDTGAILDPSELRVNVRFLDQPTCRSALDACLVEIYGAAPSANGCDGCDCGGCDCGDSSNDNSSCSSTDDNTNNSCGGCNNDGGGGGCGNDSGGCNNSNSKGCTVARAPSRGAGLAAGLIWVLLPVPAALLARRRTRRSPPA